jgi:uncharacterized protein (DUF433 family)
LYANESFIYMKKKVLKTIGEPASSWLMELGGEARVARALTQTRIDPSNFPLIMEALREARTQDEIAADFGVSRATLARSKQLALRWFEKLGLTDSTQRALRIRGHLKTNKLAELGGEKRVAALLRQTQMERSSFPIVMEALREARTQDEIAAEFEVSRAEVARLKRLALRRLEEFGLTVSSSWVPTRVIVPSPLAALLTQFAESFEDCRNEAAKRAAVQHLEQAIIETTKTLAHPKRARA